jgi:N-acetylglucosamine-6-sulfatase
MFHPAKRHAGRYKDKSMPKPKTMADTPENYKDKPMWLKNQRNSWHGVEFAYHEDTNIAEHYRLYCEALLSVDDSIATVRKWLAENGLAENTLVMYMGDNGFQWGEHGLIDKRTAYEASMRVPLVGVCPGLWKPGTKLEQVVANIDIAPTILEAAGLKAPENMDGTSFLQLAAGKHDPKSWRQNILYEYYWEYNYPHTPTTFALRTGQYKFIQYHGVWDLDELYDLKADPLEEHNLIFEEQHQQRLRKMREDLHKILEDADANRVPFSHKTGMGSSLRSKNGSEPADFPEQWMRGGDSPEKQAPKALKNNPKSEAAAKTPDHKPNYKLFAAGSLTGDFEGACCEYHMVQLRLERMAAAKAAENEKKAPLEKAETRLTPPTGRPPLPNY